MASFVSLSFFRSTAHSQASSKRLVQMLKSLPEAQSLILEIPPRKLAKATVVSRRAGTASKLVLPWYSKKSISMNWENFQSVRLTSRPFLGIVSSSSRNMVLLTGYWVGPDVDDGWGYIEAFIDRIT